MVNDFEKIISFDRFDIPVIPVFTVSFPSSRTELTTF